MKSEVPKPVFIAIVVAIALLGGILAWRFAANTGTIPNPKGTEISKEGVPKHILDQLPPDLRAKAEADAQRYGTVTEEATKRAQEAASGKGAPPAGVAPGANPPTGN